MLFTELELKEPILRGLKQLGYEQTTPIQEQTIVAFANGKDIVGQSQTGTGKTAAFTLPLLNVLDPELKKIQAIILVPTRELAQQTQEEFFNLGRFARIRALAAYGGKSIRFQKKLIDEGMHVAVCTPGRAMDLIKRKFIDPDLIKYFVLDEVDRMLDMGFIDDVERLRAQCPNIQQTMLFSATITSEVKTIINNHLDKDHTLIEIEPEQIVVDRIDHAFTMAPHITKPDLLINWVESHKEHKIIVFTQTKYATSDIANMLYDKGYSVGQLSGDMEQRERQASLRDYKENKIKIMVATDVASRGLNMKDIDLVINFDVPQDPESYVHRIGRTARAGKDGKAIMFVSEGEMKTVQTIERRNKLKIKQIDAEGNEVERKANSDRGGRPGWSRFGRSGGSRFGGASRSGWGSRFGGGSRFPWDRGERNDNYNSRDERRPFGERRPMWDRPAGEGFERRPSSDSSFRSERRPDDRGGREFGQHSNSSFERRSRFPRAEGSERRFSSDRGRSAGSDRGDRFKGGTTDGRSRPSRFERPSTKDLMKDIIPNTKPERGSYWGRD